MRKDQAVWGLCAVFSLGCLSAHVFGLPFSPEPRVRTVKVNTEGSSTDFWRVTRAELSEDVTGVEMRVEVQNSSSGVVAAGRFYAEYYDANQRRCLTAMFDLRANLERRTAGVRPGDATTLYTGTYGLFPTTEPASTRVYWIPGNIPLTASVVSSAAAVDRPASVAATSRHATDTWQRLCLDQATSAATPPTMDLLLAEAEIDASGEATGMDVLNVISSEVQTWFQAFAPHLRFRPATEDLRPRSAKTLLLVRAVMPTMRHGVVVPPPRDSDWVRQQLENANYTDLPWINLVLLDRAVQEPAAGNEAVQPLIPTSAPHCLEYYGTGTEWSVNTRGGADHTSAAH